MTVQIVFEDSGELKALVLDATTDETHRIVAVATENEVERGVSVSDHVRPERRQLQLSVVISDTPITPTSDLGGSVRAKSVDVGGAGSSSFQIYQPDSTPTRVQDSWKIILDALNGAWLATITTRLETYSDHVLIEAQVARTAADGTWIRADLTFVQIRQVATETVSDPQPARSRDHHQSDRGSQATHEAARSDQSLAAQSWDGVAGLFH